MTDLFPAGGRVVCRDRFFHSMELFARVSFRWKNVLAEGLAVGSK